MAQYDLTPKFAEHLDKHLVIPLLEFLAEKKSFSTQDILASKYELLSKTNMVDFSSEIYKLLHGSQDPPPNAAEKREEILCTLDNLKAEAQPVIDLIQDSDVMKHLKQDKFQNLQHLEEKHQITTENIESLHRFAFFQFQCGNYAGAAEILYHFRILSTDQNRILSACWGKLACEILTNNLENAWEELSKLRDTIEQRSWSNPLQLLQQRSCLVHWCLFVFFNHPKGRDAIVDMFFQPQYINTIQTSCPYILRYLTTAVITNKRRKNILKDLIKIIQQESYRDPIIEFVESLYIKFDFDEAREKLSKCDQVLDNDFFLVATRDDFIENARFFVFETYCRVHECIDITRLSEKLNLSKEEGEKWIVQLVRDTRADAKIDLEKNVVLMASQPPSIYQQVIERTKGLAFRSQVLASLVEKREQSDVTNSETKA